MTFPTIVQRFLVAVLAAGTVAFPAHAEIIRLFDANGILIGATGVVVNEISYDVTFVDGTCADVFSGACVISNFQFRDEATAREAARVLLSPGVLLDVTGHELDSNPRLTFGCAAAPDAELISPCVIYTPFGTAMNDCCQGVVLVAATINGCVGTTCVDLNASPPDAPCLVNCDFTTTTLAEFGFDSNAQNFPPTVWARWQPTPEPHVVSLLCLGFLALLAARRGSLPNRS